MLVDGLSAALVRYLDLCSIDGDILTYRAGARPATDNLDAQPGASVRCDLLADYADADVELARVVADRVGNAANDLSSFLGVHGFEGPLRAVGMRVATNVT